MSTMRVLPVQPPSVFPAHSNSFAESILRRVDELADVSSKRARVSRAVMSSDLAQTSALVIGWMEEAGMSARVDAAGNVVGRYEGAAAGAPAILVGSHLHAARDAGRFDGVLGVTTAIACVAALARDRARLPCAIEVIGFCDQDGARFGATMLGSRAFAGFSEAGFPNLRDPGGVTWAEVMRANGIDPDRIDDARRGADDAVAFIEVHVEQGPVLHAADLPLGCVTAICGATQLAVTLTGVAAPAGATPMDHRADALAGAAACVLAVEQAATATRGVVATVGRLTVDPGDVAVIPGHVAFTVDVRAPVDDHRLQALRRIEEQIVAIGSTRRLGVSIARTREEPAATCAPALQDRIKAAIAAQGVEPFELASGAGHDAAIMSRLVPVGMIFVRCRDGLGRAPGEQVQAEDIEAGASALLHVLRSFGDVSDANR